MQLANYLGLVRSAEEKFTQNFLAITLQERAISITFAMPESQFRCNPTYIST